MQAQEPRNPEPLIKLGLKYQKRHHREKALDCFKNAAALDPDGKTMMKLDTGEMVACKELADFHYGITFLVTWGRIDNSAAKAYLKNYPSGRFLKEAYLEISRTQSFRSSEGQAFFDEFLSRFPDDPDVLNVYVEKASRDLESIEGNPVYEQCVGLAGRMIESYPEITHFEATKYYAQLLVNKDDRDRAAKVFGDDFIANEIQSWSENLLSYAEFWFNQKQNMGEAEEAVVKAMNLSPENPDVLRRAAAAYHIHLDNTEKALQIFGPDVMTKICSNARALYDYFKFWMTLETNEESAENALNRLWELKPDTVYYRLGAAEVYRKAGRMEKALAIFGPDFVAARHNDFSALYDYGMYWIRFELNLESAVTALTRALSLSPRKSLDHWQAARALDKIGKPEAALEVFGPAYLPNIKEDSQGLSYYTDYWTRLDQNKESVIEALEMAIRLENLSSYDLYKLAFASVRAGLSVRAEEFYGPEYLSEILDDPLSLHQYASFWAYQKKNLRSALEAAEQACQIDDDSPRQWSTKARILMGLNRHNDALKAIDKAISLEKSKEDKERHEPIRKQILEVLGKKK